jgi:hypothetical protein
MYSATCGVIRDVWWLCINTSFLVMFMSLLGHLESQLLVIHGEIRLKQEHEPKGRNWEIEENIPKYEESCHVDQGTWHVARMWSSWLRSRNFMARCNTRRAMIVWWTCCHVRLMRWSCHDWIVTWHHDGLSETLKFFLFKASCGQGLGYGLLLRFWA